MNDDSVLALGDIVLLHLHCAALPHLPLFSSLWLSVARDKCLCQVHLSWRMTHMMLRWKALPRPQVHAMKSLSPWICSATSFPCQPMWLQADGGWEDPWRWSGPTKPINTSPNSPLITERLLKGFTLNLWVRENLSFPRSEGKPYTFKVKI